MFKYTAWKGNGENKNMKAKSKSYVCWRLVAW